MLGLCGMRVQQNNQHLVGYVKETKNADGE